VSGDDRQAPLFVDSVFDALTSLVRAVPGGSKEVGHRLWPSLSPERAGRALDDCLNIGRREKLGLDEFVHLLRIGREVGFHAAKHWLDAEAGYMPSAPADPEDHAHELVRTVEQSARELRRATEALERFSARYTTKAKR
jgi:hypothetical protein